MTDKNKEALEALNNIIKNIKTIQTEQGSVSKIKTRYLAWLDCDLETIRQALERPQVDVAGLRQTVADCEDKHGLQKGFYWQAWRHGWNECIDHLNEQGYLSQPEVIEVDLVSSFCEVVDDNNSAVVNHAVLEFYKSLYEKYKNKTIRIVDREGE